MSTSVELTAAPHTSQLAQGFLWTIAGRALAVSSLFISTTILARLLTTTEFAAWLLVNNALSIFCLFSMVGTNRTVVRFLAEALADVDYARGCQVIEQVSRLVLRGTLIVGVILAVTAWSLGDHYLLVPVTPILLAMIVAVFVLRTVQQTLAEMFRGFHDLANAAGHSGATGSALSNGLFAGMLMLAIWNGVSPRLEHVLMASAVSLVVTIPIGLNSFRAPLGSLLRRRRSSQLGEEVAPNEISSSLLASSISLMWIQVFGLAAQTSDLWVAGFALPREDVAWYASAKQLVILMIIPLQMINLTVLAAISSFYRQQNLGKLETVARAASTVSAILGCALLIPLVVAPGFLLGIFYGHQYSVAAIPLTVLAVGQLFNIMTGPCGLIMMMTGHERECLRINLVAVLVLAAFGPLAAHFAGSVGLAAVTSGVLALQNLTLWYRARIVVGVWTHPGLSLIQLRSLGRAVRREVPA